MANHGNCLALLHAHSVEHLRVADDFVTAAVTFIQPSINIEEARDRTKAGDDAILLGDHRGRGAQKGIDGDGCRHVAGGLVFEQSLLQDGLNPLGFPLHRFPYPNWSSALRVFSVSTTSSAARLRMPATTCTGALDKKPSLVSCRSALACSFANCASSLARRSRSTETSMARSYTTCTSKAGVERIPEPSRCATELREETRASR